MKTKLITALRTCAKAIEQETFAYDWSQPQSCNCGVVACALMGKSIAEMAELIAPMRKPVCNWKSMVASYCPVTGVPKNEVFKALTEAGMSQTDIVELEFLSNKDVLARIKIVDYVLTETIKDQAVPGFVSSLFGGTAPVAKTRTITKKANYYTGKKNAIAYMRAWADLLTEEGREDSVGAELSQKQTTTKA